MPLFPYPPDVSNDLRTLFRQDRRARRSRDMGATSITRGEGSFDLYRTDDGPVEARYGDLPGGGFGVGITHRGAFANVSDLIGINADGIAANSGRLDGHESRLGTAEGRLDGHSTRLGNAEGRLDTHAGRLGSVENKNDQQDGRLDSHAGRIGAVEGSSSSLATRIGNAEGRLDAHATRLGATENKNAAQDGRLDSHVSRIGALENRMSQAEDRLSTLNDRVRQWISVAQGNVPNLPDWPWIN